MTVYSFYIFDRHSKSISSTNRKSKPNINKAECIYSKRWAQRPLSQSIKTAQRQSGASALSNDHVPGVNPKALSNEDDAKLIFGAIFSLRRMVRQLGGEDDR
jgi:hypothetical protein